MSARLDTRQLLRKMSVEIRRELFERAGPNDLLWITMSESKVEPLIEALDRMDDSARRVFQGTLQEIAELADEGGTKLLVEELQAKGRKVPPEFHALQSHEDRAAWCHLHRAKEFRNALNFARADSFRSSRTWIRRNGLPTQEVPNPRKSAKLLEESLRTFYWEKEQRGRLCCVEHTRKTSGEDYFFCYIENYPNAGTTLNEDGQPVRSTEVPVFDNVFVFNAPRGELEMYAPGGKPVVEPLQQLFGHALFNRAIGPADPLRPAYSLDHLLTPDRPLRWDAQDPVQSAAITRFRLQLVHRPSEYIEIGVDPEGGPGRIDVALAEYLNSERLTSDRLRVKQATFRLKFVPGFRARSLTFYVGAPSSCDLKNHPESLREIGRRFLVLSGVVDA